MVQIQLIRRGATYSIVMYNGRQYTIYTSSITASNGGYFVHESVFGGK
jgi:hypothetical protein